MLDETTRQALERRWQEGVAILAAKPGVGSGARPWVLAEDAQSVALSFIERLGLKRIIEFGSGVSTVILARAAQAVGLEFCLSVENDPAHFAATERLLTQAGVRDRIQLVHAPIELCRVGSYFGFCYAWDPGRDDQCFDLALIDGPRARTYGRFMTLPLLWRHLSPGSLVLVDDARRSSLEGVWLQDWSRMFDGSLRWQTDLAYAKGLALLMKTDDSEAPRSDWRLIGRSTMHCVASLGRLFKSRLAQSVG